MNRYYISIDGKHIGTVCAHHIETVAGMSTFYSADHRIIAIFRADVGLANQVKGA